MLNCKVNSPNNWEWRGEWKKLESKIIDVRVLKSEINLVRKKYSKLEKSGTIAIYYFQDLNLDRKTFVSEVLFLQNSNVYLAKVQANSIVKDLLKLSTDEAKFFNQKIRPLNGKFYTRDFLGSDSVNGTFAVFENENLVYYFKSHGYGCEMQIKKDLMYECKVVIEAMSNNF